jgi:hypothetical protein
MLRANLKAHWNYWVKETTVANNDISRNNLLKKVNANLKANNYKQVAQLECPATQRGLGISPR